MSLKDRFDKFIDYFTEDGEDASVQTPELPPISDDKVTINVRYPRKYEETTEIVDLLIVNESILIDFQYMTEVQARRCLDYLDGARYVLAGNIKKVASTMYLLTPINVVVNVEDLKLPEDLQSGEFDFDMKRR